MPDRVVIRFDIILSNETFGGKYHQGGSVAPYRLCVGVEMRKVGDDRTWRQLPGDNGKIDPRMPTSGAWQQEGADISLYAQNWPGSLGGTSHLATLADLLWSPVAMQERGTAKWFLGAKAYSGPQQYSALNWLGKGTWTVLLHELGADDIDSTGWKFKTSGGASGGAVIVSGGFGTVVLTDPFGRDVRFKYLAGGFSKGLKFGATASREEFWNKGNVFRHTSIVGRRELTTADFLGACWWGEFGAAAFGGVSAMYLFAGCPSIVDGLSYMSYKASIPILGVVGGGGLGIGVQFGKLSLTW